MIEIEKPRIERVEASDSYGKFVVEPPADLVSAAARSPRRSPRRPLRKPPRRLLWNTV